MMSAFAIGCLVYVAIGMMLGIWSVRTAKKRAGPLMSDFLANREEIGRRLRAGATSRWDPFSESGGKRWQTILWIAFGILVVLLFSGL